MDLAEGCSFEQHGLATKELLVISCTLVVAIAAIWRASLVQASLNSSFSMSGKSCPSRVKNMFAVMDSHKLRR
jgi:hypothetical protein